MPRFTNSLLIIATAFLFSACAMQSNQQSAMEAEQEIEFKAKLAKCENNNAESCFELGDMLLSAGRSDDKEKMLDSEMLFASSMFYMQSCELNHGDGCLMFATTLLLGELNESFLIGKQNDYQSLADKISKENLDIYMKYIKKSCELDSANGCDELGRAYFNGDDVKKDEKLGFFYRKKGCDLAQNRHKDDRYYAGRAGGVGCARVGLMYYNGEGVAKNKQLALKYFDRGCGVLGEHCGNYVRWFYEGYNGKIIKVPQDYEFAFKLAKKGCEANDSKSCNYLGILYLEGKGVAQDFKKAFWTFYELCYKKSDSIIPKENGVFVYIPYNSGYKEIACYNLAICYANGQGTEQNYKRAFGMFQKLCDEDEMGGACGMVGNYYYDAKGIRQDYRSALHYFGKACDLGEQSGCDNHKMMKRNPYAYSLRESDFR